MGLWSVGSVEVVYAIPSTCGRGRAGEKRNQYVLKGNRYSFTRLSHLETSDCSRCRCALLFERADILKRGKKGLRSKEIVDALFTNETEVYHW